MTDPIAQPEDALSIASELIRARTERNITQAHLSELSGVSRSAIKGYESGRNMPGSRELKALCQALNVTPNRLLFGAEAITFGDGRDDAATIDRVLAETKTHDEIARRLTAMVPMLTREEGLALLGLARSIATARHGSDTVQRVLLQTDAIGALWRTVLQQVSDRSKDGAPIDAAEVSAAFAKEMERLHGVPLLPP